MSLVIKWNGVGVFGFVDEFFMILILRLFFVGFSLVLYKNFGMLMLFLMRFLMIFLMVVVDLVCNVVWNLKVFFLYEK